MRKTIAIAAVMFSMTANAGQYAQNWYYSTEENKHGYHVTFTKELSGKDMYFGYVCNAPDNGGYQLILPDAGLQEDDNFPMRWQIDASEIKEGGLLYDHSNAVKVRALKEDSDEFAVGLLKGNKLTIELKKKDGGEDYLNFSLNGLTKATGAVIGECLKKERAVSGFRTPKSVGFVEPSASANQF